MTKIIIAGSRGFTDFNLLVKAVDRIINTRLEDKDITIVSGHARGADLLGEKYANLRGYYVSEHPADWDKYGRGAGAVRNAEMGKEGDVLITFWDMHSSGTRNMIEIATRYNLKVYVIDYKNRKILEDYKTKKER